MVGRRAGGSGARARAQDGSQDRDVSGAQGAWSSFDGLRGELTGSRRTSGATGGWSGFAPADRRAVRSGSPAPRASGARRLGRRRGSLPQSGPRQASKRRLQRAAPGGEADLRQLAGGLHRGGDELGAARHAVVVGARRGVARRRDLRSAGARGRGRRPRASPSGGLGLRRCARLGLGLRRPPAAAAPSPAPTRPSSPSRRRARAGRCGAAGRVLGRLPNTSRSPLPPEEESLEAMAMILPHRSSDAPHAPET